MGPEELKIFHNLDRILYLKLASDLSVEPQISKLIVAFLNWLESCGYSKVVYKLIQMPDSEILTFVLLAVYCLQFLQGIVRAEGIPGIEAQTGRTIPMLLGREFSLWLLHENRDMALMEMSQFVNDVCVKAFSNSSDDRSSCDQVCSAPKDVAHWILAQRYQLQVFHTNGLLELQDFSSWRLCNKVRTLVVSFLRTHRFSRDDLYDIFARQYGVRVSAIDMKDWQENENTQPDVMFARVVLERRGEIKKILEGDEKVVVLLSASGRVICVRRFVTLKEANDIHNSRTKPKKSLPTE